MARCPSDSFGRRRVLELYAPIVRPGKGYPDTIKLKVLTTPAPECYTTEQETISLDEIEKGQRAMRSSNSTAFGSSTASSASHSASSR